MYMFMVFFPTTHPGSLEKSEETYIIQSKQYLSGKSEELLPVKLRRVFPAYFSFLLGDAFK